jgi:hypothetical protein
VEYVISPFLITEHTDSWFTVFTSSTQCQVELKFCSQQDTFDSSCPQKVCVADWPPILVVGTCQKRIPMIFIVFVLAARNSVEGLLWGSFAFIQPLAGPRSTDETRMLAGMALMWAKKWSSGFSAFQTQLWINMSIVGSLLQCILHKFIQALSPDHTCEFVWKYSSPKSHSWSSFFSSRMDLFFRHTQKSYQVGSSELVLRQYRKYPHYIDSYKASTANIPITLW